MDLWSYRPSRALEAARRRRPTAARGVTRSFVVGGRPEEFLSPFEAIDVGLADARLNSWLQARPLDRTQKPIVEFDRQLGLWAVGSVFDGDLVNTLHAAFIDPISARSSA